MTVGLVVLAIAAYFALSRSAVTPQVLLKINPNDHVLGSLHAPVTIYEFGDFQCPRCDQWSNSTEPQILQNLINTNQAKLVWKDFIIYGPDSNLASKAAYAAGEQGKFWQFYDTLYTDQKTPDSGWASGPNLEKFAQNLGLNLTQFNESFNSGKYDALIASNFSQGQQLGVQGTPTFIVVGPTGKSVTIAGAQPFTAFQQAVNAVSSGG